jgi:SAM-dependent methyltransferase
VSGRGATGERVFTSEGGFNPTWQRHVAAYALSAPHLPDGRIADLGCGVGHSYDLLSPRETVGIDVEAAALEGQDRETIVADIRRLPLADASFDGAIAVHSVEHVPDPERAVTEAARIVRPGGVAVIVTPNRLTFARPEEIIDPYHYVELDPEGVAALCRPAFAAVELRGIFGSRRYRDLVALEHRRLDRLLDLDPLRLRRLVPRRARQRLYDLMLGRARRESDPRAAEIGPDDFSLAAEGLEECLDVVAICHR